jgi:ABC-type histidine transport system ATPase subunit
VTATSATAAAEPIIRARNVTKSFGALEVLRGVDFDVAASQVSVVIGPSGSGKSTLLRCINYLEVPSAGDIFIDGESLCYRADPGGKRRPRPLSEVNRIRRELGIVFQQFNLWPHMTVLGNVIEAPQRVRGLARKQAIELGQACLKRVHLGDKANEYPARLSGGQ